MTDVVELTLLGVKMSGIEQPYEDLIWTDIQGWDGLTALRGSTDPIPGQNGNFKRSRGYRESRAMTVIGHIYSASNAEYHARKTALKSALAVTFGDLTVETTSSGRWTRYVEIENVDIPSDRGGRTTRFAVDMLANDPNRYQDLVTVGPVGPPVLIGGVRFPQSDPWNFGSSLGGVSELLIENTGGVILRPTVRVLGSFGTVTVTDLVSGRVLALTWPVSTSSVFDNAARRTFADGANVTREMSGRQWLEIPPHGSARLTVSAGGTPDVEMFADYRIGEW